MSTFFANGHPLGPCSYRGPVLPLDLAAARPQGLHPGLGARYAAVDGARARVVRRLDLGGNGSRCTYFSFNIRGHFVSQNRLLSMMLFAFLQELL